MPEHILYGAIYLLGTSVLILVGLWIKAHDNHRQWAVQKITEHEMKVAILEKTSGDIRDDIREIKETLRLHLEKEDKFQAALLTKFGLEIK